MAAKVCEFISGVNLTFQYRFQGTVPAGSQVDSENFIFNPLEIKVAKPNPNKSCSSQNFQKKRFSKKYHAGNAKCEILTKELSIF